MIAPTHSTLILRSGPKDRVSKDGRESEPAAMVRDASLRDAPHHEVNLFGRTKACPA